jgi:hypothetical protein
MEHGDEQSAQRCEPAPLHHVHHGDRQHGWDAHHGHRAGGAEANDRTADQADAPAAARYLPLLPSLR